MLDTGLIAAQIAFLLLLYLFVWRIVRSSSKSIDPALSEQADKSAPPVVAPVVAPLPPAAAPAPAPVETPVAQTPAVVRIPPPAQQPAPAAEHAPVEPAVAEPPPVPGDGPEHHPLLDDPMPQPEGESALDHAPEWEPGDSQDEPGWTPAAEPAPEDATVASASEAHDGGEEDTPPALAGEEQPAPDADAAAGAAIAAGALSDTGSSRRQRSESGVLDLANLSPKLVVEESPALEKGIERDLAGGLTIGRSGSSDFPVDDPFVSHMHARILRRGAYYFVEDLGSTNGTFLNEQEVERDARLKVRDTLRIGQTVLRYEE